jgi:hypothetical protein
LTKIAPAFRAAADEKKFRRARERSAIERPRFFGRRLALKIDM